MKARASILEHRYRALPSRSCGVRLFAEEYVEVTNKIRLKQSSLRRRSASVSLWPQFQAYLLRDRRQSSQSFRGREHPENRGRDPAYGETKWSWLARV